MRTAVLDYRRNGGFVLCGNLSIFDVLKIKIMKRKLFVIFSFVLLSSLIFIACNTDDQDGLTVGFSKQNGTGGNPDNTSAGTTTSGSTTSTSMGSTSTTTSGSTASTGSWFKENSVLYNNCAVIGT